MKKKIFSALGLMSGTSMDGVDVSLIKSDGINEFTSILDIYFEFNPKLREKLIELREKIFSEEDLKKNSQDLLNIEKDFTLFNCQIVEKIIHDYKNQIDLIGFHGQTIFHNSSKKFTKQLGDGKLLSQIVKKIVINNFREDDLKNGGEGAPLAPIFHKLLSQIINKIHKINYPINIINIGGITNVTNIYQDNVSLSNGLNAFDIAPGNCLIDEWVRKNSKNKFDRNGLIARAGKVNELILNQALDNFNITNISNALDIKDFDISFVKGLTLEDGCATLTKFTASLIARGIDSANQINNFDTCTNLVCGGGRKNKFLIESINENIEIKNNKLEDIDQFDFNGDFVESQAFAYLAIRSFLKLPISFPSTTRCKSPTVGGVINKNF